MKQDVSSVNRPLLHLLLLTVPILDLEVFLAQHSLDRADKEGEKVWERGRGDPSADYFVFLKSVISFFYFLSLYQTHLHAFSAVYRICRNGFPPVGGWNWIFLKPNLASVLCFFPPLFPWLPPPIIQFPGERLDISSRIPNDGTLGYLYPKKNGFLTSCPTALAQIYFLHLSIIRCS